MTTIYEFSRDWYGQIVTQKFAPRSLNQAANRPWGGGGQAISGPHSQMWLSDVTLAPMRDPTLQDIDSFLRRLKGRKHAMRISHATRLAPWYDRNITPTVATWSDGALFTNGSGFANGYLPPNIYVYQAAAAGANFIILSGFPASTANVIRRGDLLEIKPNGVPATFPHCYAAEFSCSSDASGRVGIEIWPLLRAGVAAGDQVGLRFASSVFRLSADDQGEAEYGGAGIGNRGFSLIEALDLIP